MYDKYYDMAPIIEKVLTLKSITIYVEQQV